MARLRPVVVTIDLWLVLGVVLLAGDPFLELSSSSSMIDNCLSRSERFSTGLFSRCSEILIRADRRGSSGDTFAVAVSFVGLDLGGRPGELFFTGDVFRAGDALRAGEAFLAGDAFRAGDALRVGDVRLPLDGDALRPGDAFLAGGGDGVLFRTVDFRPRLAVSAGPGTTPDELTVGAPPLVARRLSIPPLLQTEEQEKPDQTKNGPKNRTKRGYPGLGDETALVNDDTLCVSKYLYHLTC